MLKYNHSLPKMYNQCFIKFQVQCTFEIEGCAKVLGHHIVENLAKSDDFFFLLSILQLYLYVKFRNKNLFLVFTTG